ncbi:hypothetical protein [Mycobacterium sp. MS1601]|uniref:hypothetical protein n=1 Tax=Mycobacterium sp. MS1601 TaxID=1936029 RepID=UPI001269FF14|nr:hypothetical protein [Mycobacterium sp. MS1601]
MTTPAHHTNAESRILNINNMNQHVELETDTVVADREPARQIRCDTTLAGIVAYRSDHQLLAEVQNRTDDDPIK